MMVNRKNVLLCGAASIGLVLASSGYASADPVDTEINIEQLIIDSINDIDLDIDNEIDVSASSTTVNNVVQGYVDQTALNSLNTIGSTGEDGAANYIADLVKINQIVSNSEDDGLDVELNIDNDIHVAAERGSATASGSQIGTNIINQLVAAVGMDGSVAMIGQAVDMDSEDDSDFDQWIDNHIDVRINGSGVAVIDGSIMADDPETDEIERSVQYGNNVQNLISLSGIEAPEGEIKVGFGQYSGSSQDNPYIHNYAYAYSPAPTATQNDPAVLYLDQVALTTINTVSFGDDANIVAFDGDVPLPIEDLRLPEFLTEIAGDGLSVQLYDGYQDGSDGASAPEAYNEIMASTGDYADDGGDWNWDDDAGRDGRGISNIADASQSIVTRINSVSSEDNIGLGSNFAQIIVNFDVNPQDVVDEERPFDDESQNFAVAYSGNGRASIENLDQMQSLALNQFSAGSVTVVDTDADAGEVDLIQVFEDSDYQLEVQNFAAAQADGGVQSMENVGQTIMASLNSISVDGSISGGAEDTVLHITQSTGDGVDFELENDLEVGDNGPDGPRATLANGSQLLVASVNTITVGSLDAGSGVLNVSQLANDVQSDLDNEITVEATVTAKITGTTQTAVNRVNAIIAATPSAE